MYTAKFLSFVAPVLITLAVSAEEPLRILDEGMEGNGRLYTITCPNGNISSVTVRYNLTPVEITDEQRKARVATGTKPPEIAEVCAITSKGQKCKPVWDLEDAAWTSCDLNPSHHRRPRHE